MKKLLVFFLALTVQVAVAQVKAKPGVRATATSVQHFVDLSWQASSSAGVQSYNVYRGLTAGGESLLTTGVAGTTYSDTTVAAGTTYYYEVTAVCPTQCNPTESAKSNEVSAVVPLDPAPQPPSNLSVTQVAHCKACTPGYNDVLAWQASPTLGVIYRVYRATNAGGPFTNVAGGFSRTKWTDQKTNFGASYWYYVKAYSQSAKLASVASNVVESTIPAQ